MNKHIKLLFASALAIAAASSCVQLGDKFDPDREAIVIGGLEKGSLIVFPVEEAPASFAFTINATGPVKVDTEVSLAIDNSLLEEFNKKNVSSYESLPETDLELSETSVVISEGQVASKPVYVKLTTFEHFADGSTYVIPVTITSVKGELEPLEAERTIYLKISRTLILSSIDINNAGFSSTFVYSDDKMKSMGNYTIEIKIYPYSWNGMTPSLSRLCSFGDKNNGGSLLYRFGEKNAEDVLQIKTPGGELISNTHYELNKWTMLSVVYNGSNIALFNDGVKDVDNASNAEDLKWQCIELGMSWTDYGSKQLYHGRISEVRVWDRALTSGEIKAGLCGVPANSEGLVAYYKFNEKDGTVFVDATGNGYDMDWAKSVREFKDGEGNKPNPSAANYINRIADDKNKCSN